MPSFAVGVAYTYRKRTNFVWDAFEKTRGAGDFYTSADYALLATPVTGTLPDGSRTACRTIDQGRDSPRPSST